MYNLCLMQIFDFLLSQDHRDIDVKSTLLLCCSNFSFHSFQVVFNLSVQQKCSKLQYVHNAKLHFTRYVHKGLVTLATKHLLSFRIGGRKIFSPLFFDSRKKNNLSMIWSRGVDVNKGNITKPSDS